KVRDRVPGRVRSVSINWLQPRLSTQDCPPQIVHPRLSPRFREWDRPGLVSANVWVYQASKFEERDSTRERRPCCDWQRTCAATGFGFGAGEGPRVDHFGDLNRKYGRG